MKANIVKIGNSQGVRIPKVLLQQCQLDGEVELEPHSNELVIRSTTAPRAGWDEAFKKAVKPEKDPLTTEFSFGNEFDDKEWVWE